jgi:hypothetical protein
MQLPSGNVSADDIRVQLVRGDQQAFVVARSDTGVLVTADVGLSEAQVRAACVELGDLEEPVLAAWRGAVGL